MRFQFDYKRQRKFSAFGSSLLPALLAACGGNGPSSTPTPTPTPSPTPTPTSPQTIQGSVFLGPIEGATVFYDENANGQRDVDEPFVVSDANGDFEIVEGSGDLLAIGGRDVLFGFDYASIDFRAPSGAALLSPITTLLAQTNDRIEFENNTGISGLDALDPQFDILTYSPFAAENIGNGQLNDLIVFLNQSAFITLNIVEAVAQVTGIADPKAYALDLVANNVAAVPPNTVGLFTADIVVETIAAELIGSGVAENRTQAELVEALIELTTFYAVRLAANTELFSSETVQSIVQEAVITVEGLIFGLQDDTTALRLSPGEIFPDSDALELEIGRTRDLINSVEGSTFIAARSGGILTGTDLGEFLRGRIGDDVIDGANGDDIILGGTGNDTLIGGPGDDIILKRDGSGTVDAGLGDDIISLGFVDVEVQGGEGIDILVLAFSNPISATEDNKTPYLLDVDGEGLFLEIDGVTVISAAVSGIEEYQFERNAEIQFTGSNASEIVSAPTSDIRIFVSGGDDQFFNSGISTAIVDFSDRTSGATISSPMSGDGDLAYDFGSLVVSGGINQVIGSDFGDQIFSRRFPFEMQLGAGADTIFIEQITNFRLSNFSSDGQIDTLDFTTLAGAEIFLLDLDDVIDRFREISEFGDDGEIITSLQFSYSEDDGFSPISFTIEGGTFADLSLENIILPADIV